MKNQKSLILFLISIFLFTGICYSQEEKSVKIENQDSALTEKTNTAPDTTVNKKKSALDNLDFILQFEPTLYLSPESKKNNSNVVNMIYPIGFGVIWPTDFLVSFQPMLSFFLMEHLWFENMALPAEIENRTSTTLTFLLNLPAVFNFKVKKSTFQVSAGMGMMFRFGILSSGVNPSDTGYSGSAGQDLQLINHWFWDNAHWLYLTFGGTWLYPITSKIKVGPVLNAYIPIGTLIDQHNAQGLMFSIGIKLCR